MPWKPHKLRDSEVWARVDENDQLITDSDGRIDVVYKNQSGTKVYRAAARNLSPRQGATVQISVGDAAINPATTEAASAAPALRTSSRAPMSRGKGATTAAAANAAAPADAICIWTDGGCSPNPGPGGVGVVVIDGKRRIEFGDYLGDSTNNICELMAIKLGLETVATTDRERTVVVFADSAYAIGLLSQGWKAKANVELVAELRAVCKQFADLRFVKVAAHVGIKENERVDQLVNRARSARRRVSPPAPSEQPG
jgi:ribonuclease HI